MQIYVSTEGGQLTSIESAEAYIESVKADEEFRNRMAAAQDRDVILPDRDWLTPCIREKF